MMNFVDGIIEQRLGTGASDEGDLLDELIEAHAGGFLSDYELRNLLVFLFGAGYDTSKNMLTLIMYTMLDRAEDWERCAREPQFCHQVMEEAFRFHSVSNTPRTVVEDIVYEDVLIPKGSLLLFVLTMSGHDPTVFPRPECFDPGRANASRHLAFGRGMHMCLGQHLARAQIEEGIHLIAQRLKSPRRTGELSWRPFVGVWGLRTLPIAFNA